MHKADYLVTATVRFIVPADSPEEATEELESVFAGIPIVETCDVTDAREI
jgi:hypothetical protein